MLKNISSNLFGSIEWTDNAKLIQPYEVEQITMPDFANCLSIRTYLNMLNLKYQTEFKSNAEFMSPSGEVPFLQLDSVIISEVEPIINFLNIKGISLSKDLPLADLSDMKALISYTKSQLGNSLLYFTWVDHEIYNQVTYQRYSQPYKWPLSYFLTSSKKSKILEYLKAKEWLHKNTDEVYAIVEETCFHLSNKLSDKQFFFSTEKPCELDAIVFGYFYTMLTTKLPSDELSNIIAKYYNLTNHCKNLHQAYFSS